MTTTFTDTRSNTNEQIVNAAEFLLRSNRRRKVFEAIYKTKKKIKTRSEIEQITGLNNVQVLQDGKALSDHGIVKQIRYKGQVAYEKDRFFTQNKNRILRLANNPNKIKQIATKSNPRIQVTVSGIKVNYPKPLINVEKLSIDDIDNFSKIKKQNKSIPFIRMAELKFKKGLQKIIGDKGKFTDWGGEKNDLYTTRVKIKGKRCAAAFALKGKGKTGILTPNKMGKNGDQIPRLFQSEADIYILQYWHQIDQTIFELMYLLAVAKSALTQKRISYCIIDGHDSARLIEAYKPFF